MKSQINEKKKAGKKLMKPNTVSLEKKDKILWKKYEQSLRDLWDLVKKSNMYHWSPRDNRAEKINEEINGRKFLNSGE